MKSMSIRNRILAGILLVNLVVAVVVALYLHASYSRGLEVASSSGITLANGAWDAVSTQPGTSLDFTSLAKHGGDLVAAMKRITGSDYALLLSKSDGDPKAYAALRAQASLGNDWKKNRTYVLVGVTDPALAHRMTITTPADRIPESGRAVGIENGACSATCHGSVKGSGDFWGVSWRGDARSMAHSVLPISDGSGKPLGLIYSVADISSQANSDRASMMRTLIFILIGLGTATVLISLLLDGLVFGRLTHMIRVMQDISARVVGGDFYAEFVPDGTNDEIGTFEKFFAEFLNVFSSLLRSVLKEGA